MKKSFATKVSFEQIKPNVRLIKNGTILPSSNNLKLNFEAVNLSAVDVKVYKIYKNNILQFLQDNDLNGTQNLKQVSQPIAKTKLNLNSNKLINPSKWNTFALDISKIITSEPGAIYRVEFSFKKTYSLYTCETIEPSALAGQKFISFEPDIPTRKAIDRIFKEHGITVQTVMEFDNVETVKRAVEIDAGVSILPQATIAQEVSKQTLVQVPFEGEEFHRPLAALIKKNKVLSPAMKQFLAIVKDA